MNIQYKTLPKHEVLVESVDYFKMTKRLETYLQDVWWEECFESKSSCLEVWGTRQTCFCSSVCSCEPVSLAHDWPQIPYIPWWNNARTPLAWAFLEGWMNGLHQVCPVPHGHPICIIYARCLSSLRSVPVIMTDQSERSTAGQPREQCCCYLHCKDHAHLKLNLWRKMKREGHMTHAFSPRGKGTLHKFGRNYFLSQPGSGKPTLAKRKPCSSQCLSQITYQCSDGTPSL